MTGKKPLTPTQRITFRFYRSKGFSIRDARRCARMNYEQLAREISRRLRTRAKAEGHAS